VRVLKLSDQLSVSDLVDRSRIEILVTLKQ
jgi:hypothetical protein